jgi:hypothetical protein
VPPRTGVKEKKYNQHQTRSSESSKNTETRAHPKPPPRTGVNENKKYNQHQTRASESSKYTEARTHPKPPPRTGVKEYKK